MIGMIATCIKLYCQGHSEVDIAKMTGSNGLSVYPQSYLQEGHQNKLHDRREQLCLISVVFIAGAEMSWRLGHCCCA